MIELAVIREKVSIGKYVVSFTHTEKLRIRKISVMEIEQAINNGKIIEPYPGDPRGPSCLIMGFADNGRPLHIVCGKVDQEEVLIITAYEPDSREWEEDMKTRKKGG